MGYALTKEKRAILNWLKKYCDNGYAITQKNQVIFLQEKPKEIRIVKMNSLQEYPLKAYQVWDFDSKNFYYSEVPVKMIEDIDETRYIKEAEKEPRDKLLSLIHI